MKKLCLIYDTAPRYRESIYQKIDESYDCDWFFGKINAGVKEMDYTILRNVKRYNIIGNLNRVYWQCGILSLLFSNKYDTYFVGSETRAISKWLFFFLACLLFPDKKIYVWTHGWYGKESRWQAIIKKWIYNHVTGAFLYGNYAKNQMIKAGIKENKLYVIHNSLHYDQQIRLRKSIKPSNIYVEHFKSNKPIIIFIGRLTAIKKLDFLIYALKKLKDKGEYYNLVFIGNGSEYGKLKSMVDNVNITDQVWFYGACYDEKTNAELIVNADLCVAPGNVGLTAMHSMVFGCPVISHNDFKWQMPEFESIIQGKTGDFFEKDNIDSLCDTISKWFTNMGNKREEVRQNCFDEIDLQWNPYYQMKIIQSIIK